MRPDIAVTGQPASPGILRRRWNHPGTPGRHIPDNQGDGQDIQERQTPEQQGAGQVKLALADQLKPEMDAIDKRIYPNVVAIIKAIR